MSSSQQPLWQVKSVSRRFRLDYTVRGLIFWKQSNNKESRNILTVHIKLSLFTSTRFPILTLRAAFESSCKDGFSLLQALSHSAIPSVERNLEGRTIILSIKTTTVFKTNAHQIHSKKWSAQEKPQLRRFITEMSIRNQARKAKGSAQSCALEITNNK